MPSISVWINPDPLHLTTTAEGGGLFTVTIDACDSRSILSSASLSACLADQNPAGPIFRGSFPVGTFNVNGPFTVQFVNVPGGAGKFYRLMVTGVNGVVSTGDQLSNIAVPKVIAVTGSGDQPEATKKPATTSKSSRKK